MKKKKTLRDYKTLGDYISRGRHEFVAFVRDMMSLSIHSRSNCRTWGNDLGEILFGVVVCEKENPDDKKTKPKFFYKEPLIYDGDSDISFRDFSYDSAKVVSEVPLSLEVSHFHSGHHLKKRSKEFHEAKKLLKKYGLY